MKSGAGRKLQNAERSGFRARNKRKNPEEGESLRRLASRLELGSTLRARLQASDQQASDSRSVNRMFFVTAK